MSSQFTLGKNERLKSRKLIEQIFREGKSFIIQPYKTYYLFTGGTHNDQSPTFNIQFATGVSSKTFKKAVDRNRIKRLTRESYRLQKKELQDSLKEKNLQLNLFFIYISRELPDFNMVKEKVNVILNAMIKIVHENNSPHT
jgi:ribonuclease P protein component